MDSSYKLGIWHVHPALLGKKEVCAGRSAKPVPSWRPQLHLVPSVTQSERAAYRCYRYYSLPIYGALLFDPFIVFLISR